MKALKSPLGRDLLADPKAREQLRTFLVTPAASGSSTPRSTAASAVIEIHTQERSVRFKAVMVPKAG
jgi:hypothetical protein